ncbi:50S ribosomal protein L23 [Methanococcus maripaludis]|uniref:Large ribosomal subunit protein uL23 n=2 Tax=Methanococcus maripaludis TaxID=39152 RepID=RL23_METM7|nr:50S ribosomal protein L23 [Methanococcus maripaludis]A6VHD4.1 RecName: Full=Large ribosomal subunit protein uL23; AltName: Full=50S ribosomal protein L23 [Methanococcus maripaludis C7]MBA2861516.1 large subunit ribosomal protein L23 [Methanococcus maripaludis]
MDAFDVIKTPIVSEKTMKLIEEENRLVFYVERKATKADIRAAIKELFDAEVADINTSITPKGKKKAYITLKSEYNAGEVAASLGIY